MSNYPYFCTETAEVRFGFSSYKGGKFELIAINIKTGEEITLEGQLRPDQTLEQIDKVLPTCVYVNGAAATPSMREALAECIEVLELVDAPARVDPDYGEEVAALGDRIGYGALMTSASASWRERLEQDDCPTGGEFVAGPCYATVLATLKLARAAIASSDPAQTERGGA